MIGATPILFFLLIKGDYSEAYPQMPILFLGMFFSAIASFLGGIYVAHKKTKSVGMTTILAAACNLLIDLALVKSIGIFAASVSTMISYMFLAIYRMIDVTKIQKIQFQYPKMLLYLLILTGMSILCWIDRTDINIINFIAGCIFAYLINKEKTKSLIKGALSHLRGNNR